MRLIQVSLIGRYKGLSDQVFDFSNASGNVSAFIGLNGSGKSQLLELISEIFAFLERRQRSDFRNRTKLPFRFIVDYKLSRETEFINFHEQRIELNEKSELITSVLVNDNWQVRESTQFPLPDFVVGYASGLHENLQRAFMKNALQYFDVMAVRSARRKELSRLKKSADIIKTNQKYVRRHAHIFEDVLESELSTLVESDTALPSMLFLDYDCNALIMASLGLFPENVIHGLFPEITYRYPKKFVLRYDLRNVPIEEDAIRDIKQLTREVGKTAVVGRCKRSSDEIYDIYELDYLAADIVIDLFDNSLKERLNNIYYGDPFQFFQKLYKIQLLGAKHWQSGDRKNLRKDDFEGNVKKPLKTKSPLSVVGLKLSNGQTEVDFDDLSDGEAQLIQTMGAIRLFGDRNVLFLFDEPETHLNPSWRTNFHQYLMHALGNGINSHVILSTHSPFIISSLRKENVFLFERKNAESEMQNIAVETFGTSFDVLIKKYFSLRSTISQTAVDEILEKISDPSLSNADRHNWIDENIGESMEKAYLLRKLSN